MSVTLKPLDRDHGSTALRLFLAGSIEQGTAEPWQQRVEERLGDIEGLVILNPRRDAWDASWRQSADNPEFVAQVEWELDMQDAADLIVFYFDPSTRSPVTLLELGLALGRPTVEKLVCCPPGFWRAGNVELACARFGVPLLRDLSSFLEETRRLVLTRQRNR